MRATESLQERLTAACLVVAICIAGLVSEGLAGKRSERPARSIAKMAPGTLVATESFTSVISNGIAATGDGQSCKDGALQWVHPFPIGQDFWDVAIAPSGPAYAVTDRGLLVRYDGTRFDVFESPFRGFRASVFAVAPDDVYLSVSEKIAHFDGTSFQMLPPVVGCNVHSLWADAQGNIVVAGDMGGDFGCVYRFASGDWVPEIQFDQHVIFERVLGFNNNNLFVVGDQGSVLQYDGYGWTRMRTPTGANLEDIYGVRPDDLYVAADSEMVLRYDGTDWSVLFDGQGPGLIGVFANSNVWAIFAGKDYTSYGYLYYNGDSWQVFPQVNDLGMWGIAGDAASNKIITVGDRGNFATWTGDTFAPLSRHLVYDPLFDSIALGQEDVVWVGENGNIMRVKDRTWTKENSPTTDTLLSVHGLAPDDVYASGNRGGIVHYNGREWSVSREEPATWEALNAIWAAAQNEVYAIGYSPNRGAVYLRFDGANWNYFAPVPDRSGIPQKMWGSRRDDLFIVGTEGMILHFDGNGWRRMETNTTETFTSVWGRSANDVFATTEASVYHYNGNSWAKQPLQTSESTGLFTRVSGTSSGKIYVTTQRGEALLLDGSQLTLAARFPGAPYMHSISAIGDEVYFTADEAAVFRYGCGRIGN